MIAGMEARVTTRGRVTIPIELRRKLGVKPGMRLIVREEEGRTVVMTFAQYVHSLRGALRGKGLLGRLKTEKQCEAEREDRRFSRKTERP